MPLWKCVAWRLALLSLVLLNPAVCTPWVFTPLPFFLRKCHVASYNVLRWGSELVRQGRLQAMGAQGHDRLGGGVSSRLTCVEKLNQKMGQAMGKPVVS